MKRIWRCFALVYLTCHVALAQNAQFSGLVKDKTEAVIPQAKVTLRNVGTGSVIHTKTDKGGFFIYSSVEPGKYSMSAEAPGFDRTVIQGIKLDVAANVSQDIVLQVRRNAQEITVNQQVGQLAAEDGTVSTVIDRTVIENMPLNGKDLTTLFELSPGTVLNAGGTGQVNGGGFSVDGQRPTANYLTIDGTSGEAYVPTYTGTNNTGAGIATSASGGTNGILPIDAIEEYRMDTSTYTAENGRTPGGQIQVRTRSGTNDFHGTLFENFRNQVMDATDWFVKYNNIAQSQLRMNDFGGTLGGPVVIPHLFNGRNRLFFFVANDNLVLDQPSTSATKLDVPDASIVQGAYSVFKSWMSVFPSGNSGPNGTPQQVSGIPSFDYFNASYPYLVRDHTTSVRLDGQLPKSIHAFFRANIAPSSSIYPVVNGLGSKVSINTYTGGITVPLGTHIVDELTVNHTSDNTQYINFVGSVAGNDPNGLTGNLPTGINLSTDKFDFEPSTTRFTASANTTVGPSDLNGLHQWNIVDALSWQLGKHALKLGLDYLTRQSTRRSFVNDYTVIVNAGTTAPYTNTDLAQGIITTLAYTKTNSNPVISLENTSLFVNDNWKVNHWLTLNAGVRWEYNPPPSVGPLGTLALQGTTFDPSSFQTIVSNQPLYQTRYDNFAPRFGFSWSPRNDRGLATIVRGGLGVYFDTGQAATVAGVSTGLTYPYEYTATYSGLPYSSVNWTGLASNQTTLAQSTLYLVDPRLLSPRTYEWSLSLEQQLGSNTELSTSYVGNDGEKLVGQYRYDNAKNAAGQYPVNTNYVVANGYLYFITNQSHSNYQALQIQLKSKIGQRLNAIASYTWGHAEDNTSSDFSAVGATALNPIANSANDIRHIFAASIHYSPPGISDNRTLRAITGGWELDTIARLQSASPFTVSVVNTTDDNVNAFLANADVVAGQPAVLHRHIDPYGGTAVPGNVMLNWAAFTTPPTSGGVQLRNGNSPTNGYRLFGLTQWDLAASHTWKLWRELNLSFRVDAFNVLNIANFVAGGTTWNATNANTFGVATNTYASTFGTTPSNGGSQGAPLSIFENGGPRSLQLSMKLKF